MPSPLDTLDWIALAAHGALILGTGWWFSRRKQTSAKDYFLAERSMPVWAVAISTAAAALSAATFTGVPVQSYAGDLTYLSVNIGAVLAIVIVAFVFIPAFYRANTTTVYGLLEQRLGPGARTVASLAFLIGRVLALGARVYIAAIPGAIVLFGSDPAHLQSHDLIACIAVLTLVGTAYTLVGGVRSVIWTDVIQTSIFLGAAGAAVWILLRHIPASPAAIWSELAATPTPSGTKSTILSLSTDPASPYTLWTSVIGMTLFYLAAYGTDHDLTQRMLTCENARKGGRSAIVAILIQIPIIAIFLAIGSLLWAFYQSPTLMGGEAPTGELPENRSVFIAFISRYSPPGLLGLVIAGLYAAALSSLLSGLNAMGASLYADVYRKAFPRVSERHDILAGRLSVVLSGLAVGGFAIVCVMWQKSQDLTLIDLALTVMNFAYAGLLAVFLAAILTRRGNSASAVASILVGFVVIAALQPAWIGVWTSMIPGLAPTPDVATDWRLGELKLAFPWQLTIGVAISFLVCIAGKRRVAVPSP